MDLVDVVVLVVLLVCVVGLFWQAVLASRDQERALKAGEPVGSLWQHMMRLAEQRKGASSALHAGEKPKLLTPTQRKQLDLPPPVRPTFSVAEDVPPISDAGKLAQNFDQEEDKDFSHLHPDPVSPQVVAFIYENAQGELSSREVTVNQIGTSHFAGICHREAEERSFRFDRIVGNTTLESGLMVAPSKLRDHLRGYGEQELRRKRRAAAKVTPEILFTGFKSDIRADLEAQAVAAGMTVRKRVTLGLDYLCAGPNAGPAKLEEAGARGASVISPEQFLHLINTGEIPC